MQHSSTQQQHATATRDSSMQHQLATAACNSRGGADAECGTAGSGNPVAGASRGRAEAECSAAGSGNSVAGASMQQQHATTACNSSMQQKHAVLVNFEEAFKRLQDSNRMMILPEINDYVDTLWKHWNLSEKSGRARRTRTILLEIKRAAMRRSGIDV
eukprot:5591356-Lingulodinium_polyedra.AAC.1